MAISALKKTCSQLLSFKHFPTYTNCIYHLEQLNKNYVMINADTT